jgi:large subunit ribosomal protein L10
MPQPKKKLGNKEGLVSDLNDLIGKSQAIILAEYRGMTVPQVGDLRKALGTESDFSVVKNTLFKRALGDTLNPELDGILNGTTAAIFALSDPIATAKAVDEYIAATRNTPLAVKGAVMDGKFLNAAQVKQLASIPPREQLIAQIVGSISSPVSGFVGILDAIVRDFVYTIQAIADKKAA